MSEFLFLGIDGGGTKCRARLRDDKGNLLGEGSGGPSNIRLDPDLVWNSILTACREAVRQAGLQEEDLRRIPAGMGAAGAGQKSAVERLLSRPHPFASFAIDTDAHTAWLGAFGGGDGAILIVGTGSCGYGCVGGRRQYVGGWGYEISDEGSGAAIGREILRRTIWAYDGRIPATPLSRTVLAEFNDDPEILVDWVGKARPSDYARYAPLVLEHAQRRDPIGLELIRNAADEMAQIATRLLDLGAPALCIFGGLAEPLRPWLPPPLQHAIVPPAADALDGAILLGRTAQSGGRNDRTGL
ncbi:BadF/BadG/BcrA/BcrD ATPase family protein [Microvirga lenta]|uniref:BadF/BadG/BcrA/BcrD ATPase family protein n=1 Tax=Microvirga lenta TaxID=2881337 RepID=UPI001CFD4A0A|nr:BadF/BadG/BcrA/BcrD ATPase family protein [Microvirga lenta]MCB5174279.1 N-acetylglucosamine kinase [Microvirga lenta]